MILIQNLKFNAENNFVLPVLITPGLQVFEPKIFLNEKFKLFGKFKKW